MAVQENLRHHQLAHQSELPSQWECLQNPHSCPTVVNFWATQSYFENTSQGLGQGLDSLPRRLLGQYKVCKGGQMNREQKGLCGQTPTRGNESRVTDPDRPAEVKCHVFLGSLCTDTCTCVYMYTLEDNTKCPLLRTPCCLRQHLPLSRALHLGQVAGLLSFRNFLNSASPGLGLQREGATPNFILFLSLSSPLSLFYQKKNETHIFI